MQKLPTLAALTLLLVASSSFADVRVSERHALKDSLKAAGQDHPGRAGESTGAVQLTDAQGFQYFINTDITFTTTSSASGAASEASFTAAVNADTTGGGTSASTLNDAFDGFGALCVSTDGDTGPCGSPGPGLGTSNTMYNINGPATTDCGGRQVLYPVQNIGSLAVSRKVYVPDTDQFIRWANIVTNTGGAAVNVSVITSNNLGSDANTTISTTSDGDAVGEPTDSWIASFQQFSGPSSSDPRMGHVIQNSGGTVPVANLTFADGSDNPFWNYAFSLNPGETRILLTYATGQPTRAAAAAKAQAIADSPDYTCLSSTEISQIANFGAGGPPPPSVVEVPTLSVLGLAALAALLGGAAFLVLRRQ